MHELTTRTKHLRRDDEQGGLRVELGQGLGDVRSVNVGHEPDPGPAFGVGLQGLRHHQGPLEVREWREYRGGGSVVERVCVSTLINTSVCLHCISSEQVNRSLFEKNAVAGGNIRSQCKLDETAMDMLMHTNRKSTDMGKGMKNGNQLQ